jgi:hypothetical protein
MEYNGLTLDVNDYLMIFMWTLVRSPGQIPGIDCDETEMALIDHPMDCEASMNGKV